MSFLKNIDNEDDAGETPALEVGKFEKEVEYSYFVVLSPEQLDKLVADSKTRQCIKIVESKIPDVEGRKGHSRVRGYSGNKYELTTKYKTDAGDKVELNDVISKENWQALVPLMQETTLRTRVIIPVMEGGEPLIVDGKPLEWEVDLYVHGSKSGDGLGYHYLAKVEMEVVEKHLHNVVKYIPFEYTDLILSGDDNAAVRETISQAYSDYNVVNNLPLAHVLDWLD